MVELHTGAWCNAHLQGETDRPSRIRAPARGGGGPAEQLGLECHAGHGLDFDTARTIAALPQIAKLNIGHFLIGEAVFIGLDASVRQMIAAIARGRSEVKGRRA